MIASSTSRFVKRTFANFTFQAPNVAVVLSGSGVYDGSEITEATATLVHLSRLETTFQCYAPNKEQMHAVNHTTGNEHDTNRNVLEESARIARGNVKPLSDLNVDEFDALIFPGGFGAAKNLSSWAVDGVNCSVDEDVERVISSFHSASKPIGACCIAPVVIAKCIPGCTVTVGSGNVEDEENWPYAGTVGQIEELGCTHVENDITGVTVDGGNKIVTSPAYMYNGKPHEIFDSVGLMVEGVLKFAFGSKMAGL
jgi:enhancing lycopene biosynthesis protein 2